MSNSIAMRPISSLGCDTVVSGRARMSEKDISSKPTRARVSGTAIRSAMLSFALGFPKQGERMVAAVIPKDNLLSSAMHLSIGRSSVLLGADLEFSSSTDIGWDAVLLQDRVQLGKSDVYKVAHHGSETADRPMLWDRMLNLRPICAICPANNGGNQTSRESRKPLDKALYSLVKDTRIVVGNTGSSGEFDSAASVARRER